MPFASLFKFHVSRSQKISPALLEVGKWGSGVKEALTACAHARGSVPAWRGNTCQSPAALEMFEACVVCFFCRGGVG